MMSAVQFGLEFGVMTGKMALNGTRTVDFGIGFGVGWIRGCGCFFLSWVQIVTCLVKDLDILYELDYMIKFHR